MSRAAGVFFFCTSTQRFLYLLRSDTNTWSLPGGKIEQDEVIFEALYRECQEEIGFWPDQAKLVPIQLFQNRGFTYHTFYCELDTEFIPTLNHEHSGYAWLNAGHHPKPLHPGLFSTINGDTVQDKLSLLVNRNALANY